jgi:hypothetical protein
MSSFFVNPVLAWGVLLAAVPVLIHLINLLRHRRVRWAAMEFLLQSQKKNSTRVKLKELLLLLLRMAAIAAVALVLAQPILSNQLGLQLGGQSVEHIVLLDDSYSMSDRWADSSAFERAKQAIERLGGEAGRHSAPQQFTVLRFSRAGRSGVRGQPDLFREQVASDFGMKLADRLKSLQPSQQAVGPIDALKAIDTLFGESKGEQRIVYLVSDFRTKEWDDPQDLKAALEHVQKSPARMHFVHCVDTAHANVAITSLEPEGGTRAAGVPLTMAVTVKNFGADRVSNLAVVVEMPRQDGVGRSGVTIDELLPGKSETRKFQAFFPTAGDQRITARIQSDAVADDNARFSLVNLPLSVPVLIVDAEPDAPDGHILAAALAPGGAVKTGIEPRIEAPAFLNNNPLAGYHAIYLANVDRLDHAAVEALEKYVRSGGGLAVFLGPRTQAELYNQQFYRGGEGFFPLPLTSDTPLLVDRLDKGPDLEVTDHPIFRIFAGERNSHLAAVAIERFFAVPRDWKPDVSTKVIARLRNKAPLVLERSFGDGRVVAVLTTAAPTWTNWAANPSFVITLLEMQSYLSVGKNPNVERFVGQPIELKLDPGRYKQTAVLIPPTADEAGSTPVDLALGKEGLTATLAETGTSGFYELQLTTADGAAETRGYAFNVDPAEGNLATVHDDQLSARLKGIHYDYHPVDQFSFAADDVQGSNLSDVFLYLLIAMLVGEQLLAYSASYHPSTQEVAI